MFIEGLDIICIFRQDLIHIDETIKSVFLFEA